MKPDFQTLGQAPGFLVTIEQISVWIQVDKIGGNFVCTQSTLKKPGAAFHAYNANVFRRG